MKTPAVVTMAQFLMRHLFHGMTMLAYIIDAMEVEVFF